MTDRNAYLKKLEAQLEEWDAEIDKIQAKAKGVQADAKLNLEEQLNQLRARRKEVVDRMEQLRQAGESALHDVQVGAQAASARLQDALHKAQQRLRDG